MTRLLHRLTVALILVASISVANAQSVSHLCDAAAAKAERDWNVPAGVLSAVGVVESGRNTSSLGTAPWPWTINAAGQGRYFATKAEAIAGVLEHMARGFPYIDIGCFQIDIAYHPGVFRSLEDAFDPERNAQAAAEILAKERRNAPDWATAVARYHSATPGLGLPYLQLVRAAYPASKLRAVTAETIQGEGLSQPDLVRLDPATPAPILPAVIYATSIRGAVRGPQIIQMSSASKLPQVTSPDQKRASLPR